MNRKPSTPPWGYRAIAEHIIGQIHAGELKPRDALPSRRALAAHYSVSEATIANTLRHLSAAGYTVGQQGKAVTVADRSAPP